MLLLIHTRRKYASVEKEKRRGNARASESDNEAALAMLAVRVKKHEKKKVTKSNKYACT